VSDLSYSLGFDSAMLTAELGGRAGDCKNYYRKVSSAKIGDEASAGGGIALRIGEFAREHNVTIDTIRHYMEMELLLPAKTGGQYTFDSLCSNDLKEILWLKSANFTLTEIQKLFSIKRMTSLKLEDDQAYYKELLLEKQAELQRIQQQTEQSLANLDTMLRQIPLVVLARLARGIPLSLLTELVCSKCNELLRLDSGKIEDSQLINGIFQCSCGEYIAQEGILQSAAPAATGDEELPSTKEYMENTDTEFVNFINKSSTWLITYLEALDLNRKTVLVLGHVGARLLPRMNSRNKEDVLYIIVEPSRERLLYAKSILNIPTSNFSALFLCCPLHEIPLKELSVDLVIDCLGSTNYNFSKPGFAVNFLGNRLKPEGEWLGAYLYFPSGAKSVRKLKEECHPYFSLDHIQRAFQRRFTEVASMELGCVSKAGEYEAFLLPGDKVYQWVYYGKGLSKTLG